MMRRFFSNSSCSFLIVTPSLLSQSPFCSTKAEINEGTGKSFEFVDVDVNPQRNSSSSYYGFSRTPNQQNVNNEFRNRSYYFNRSQQRDAESKVPPIANEADVAEREFYGKQQLHQMQHKHQQQLGYKRLHHQTTRVPFENDPKNYSTKHKTSPEFFTGPSLPQIAQKVGGPEAQFISRKKREGDFIGKVNERIDDLWFNGKTHLQYQDKLIDKLGGSVEAAVQETLNPSTVSVREELKRRPLDRVILDEIYREQHGYKVERHLRKGLHFERWISKSEHNHSVLEGSERARQLFGLGGQIELISSTRNPSEFPQTSTPEVAFIGRTNSGRSSLLNSVFNSFVCKHGILPGTTTTADFYSVSGGRLNIVDLPGFSFYHPIQTPRAVAASAITCLKQYLNQCSPSRSTRPRNVKRVFLCTSNLVLTSNEVAYIEFMEKNLIPFSVIITKTDLVEVKVLAKRADYIRSQLANYSMCKELMLASGLRLAGISKIQNLLSELSRQTEKRKGEVVKFENEEQQQQQDDDNDEEDALMMDMKSIV